MVWDGVLRVTGIGPDQGKKMVDLTVIDEANKLSAAVTAATKKLKEYVNEHEKSEDDYFENVRGLERAVWVAHSKWIKFAEQNFSKWG